MKALKCDCGGTIVFENKKTFVNPDEKQGICLKCKCQYKLVNGKLIKKGGST